MPDLVSWLYPVSDLVLVWILLKAPAFPARGWLILAFAIGGANGLLWRSASLFNYEAFYFYETFGRPLGFIVLGAIALGAVSAYRNLKSGGSRVVSMVTPAGDIDEGATMIPRNETNSISMAEKVRDQIFGYFTEACAEEAVTAEVFLSPPYSESVWVEVLVQQPVGEISDISLRASARVTVEPKEFHRFDHELTIDLNDSVKRKKYLSVVEFTPATASKICRYLAAKDRKLKLRLDRCRTFPWQLWRPKNKLTRLKPAISIAGYVALGGIVLMPVFPLALALFGVAVLVWIIEREARRRVLSLTSGKPRQEPRALVRMDSWQAVLQDLSRYATGLSHEVREELSVETPLVAGTPGSPGQASSQRSPGTPEMLDVSDENIWYRGIDGKVERQQIVVRLRRAIGFIHIYPYGSDLYVGWDAHINAGRWSERLLGQGRDPKSGKFVRAYGIESSWQSPHEYDITDVNFLIEWIHAAVSKVVKQSLKDHRIDQEVDFTVFREPRQDVAGRSRPGTGKKKDNQKLPFRRTA